MAVRETIELDLSLVDDLIRREEAALEPKHRASIAYREVAAGHVTGGVASSWQAAPPHAIYVDRGQGSRLWDIDGNEYVDFHLGYGAMVVGTPTRRSSRRSGTRPGSGRTSPSRRSTSTRSGRTSARASGCRSGASASPGPRRPSRRSG
jgi:hypothetical protein